MQLNIRVKNELPQLTYLASTFAYYKLKKFAYYNFKKDEAHISNKTIPATQVYRKYEPSHDFLKKHLMCKGHKFVFLKINNTSNFQYEYNISTLLYKKLKGKNICKCLDFGKNYIVYEYIKHRTLDQILDYDYTKKCCSLLTVKKESHNLSKYINILKSAKNIIRCIHSYGYTIHDMHLNNLLITEDYGFYLTDFEFTKKTTNCKQRKKDFKVINHALLLLYIYHSIFTVRKTIILALKLILPNRFLQDSPGGQR